ncbi:hypothetical protein pb186bvf_009097, partial [Paramecium bursaria]
MNISKNIKLLILQLSLGILFMNNCILLSHKCLAQKLQKQIIRIICYEFLIVLQ